MNSTVHMIPASNLVICAAPLLIVFMVMFKWSLSGWTAIYAVARMVLQLVAIGYLLVYIFSAEHALVVIAVLTVMLFASSWIAMRPLIAKSTTTYYHILLSLAIGCLFTTIWIGQLVLELQPWFKPQALIPIAGMIFANAMNTLSLTAERLESELKNGCAFVDARQKALTAGLIPIINSLFAVGVVSLPGMMTGQILLGVSPLIAVRYQIMVMCMMLIASGLSSVCYILIYQKLNKASFSSAN